MKSRYFSPNQSLYQIVVQDFKHREPCPLKELYVDKSGKGIREITDHIPMITLFRRAKTAKQAMESARKKGSVISCQKVSYCGHLEKIGHLHIDMKPIEVDISAEEFTIGRNLEITPELKSKKIDVDAIDK